MRFIDTTTLQFEDVADSEFGQEYPENKYAILSDRWGAAGDEVSYADIHESRNYKAKRGFAKLKSFCDLAASLGYRYGWVDTCCINKVDLIELTEAINSMYRWYQASDLCIAYLEDVSPGRKSMMDSTWFDRGWTLQDLIGPEKVAFYDYNWTLLGMKSDILEELSTKTGIPRDVLSHAVSPTSCSVAQRMSWAAKRTTTKAEDRAYSLLGIFGVNLPLIYGEREKAFLRLQQAIVRQCKDESIFAWSMGKEDTITGLYAPSPESFAECSEIISTHGSTGFSEKNGEVSISLQTFPCGMETYYALLSCTRKTCSDSRIAILVSRTSAEEDDECVRVNGTYQGGTPLVAYPSRDDLKAREIRVPIDPTKRPLNRVHGFWLRSVRPPGHDACQVRILSKVSNQSESDKVYTGSNDWGSAGVVFIEPNLQKDRTRSLDGNHKGWSRVRWIKLGFDEEFNPMLLLANNCDPAKSTPTQFKRDENLFDQAVACGSTSQPHNEIFDNHWIYCQAGVPSRTHGWPQGISILQVNKRKGMSGTLDGLNLGVEVRLISDLSPNSISLPKPDENSRQIWAVDITDTGGRDPEQNLKDREHSDDYGDLVECYCLPVGFDDGSKEVKNQLFREAYQPGVITGYNLTRRR